MDLTVLTSSVSKAEEKKEETGANLTSLFQRIADSGVRKSPSLARLEMSLGTLQTWGTSTFTRCGLNTLVDANSLDTSLDVAREKVKLLKDIHLVGAGIGHARHVTVLACTRLEKRKKRSPSTDLVSALPGLPAIFLREVDYF